VLLIRIPAVNECSPIVNQVQSAVNGGLFQVKKKTTNAESVFTNRRNGAEKDTSHEYFSEIAKATIKETKGRASVRIRLVMKKEL
jgi:hypothetical protein